MKLRHKNYQISFPKVLSSSTLLSHDRSFSKMQLFSIDLLKKFLLDWDDSNFSLLLFLCSLTLYFSTIFSGYVWDDRAAIVSNADVHGSTPLYDLFLHDFWGQDITLADSHKSYRPITTLTFRLNHFFHGNYFKLALSIFVKIYIIIR
jgi:hypothetical protein